MTLNRMQTVRIIKLNLRVNKRSSERQARAYQFHEAFRALSDVFSDALDWIRAVLGAMRHGDRNTAGDRLRGLQMRNSARQSIQSHTLIALISSVGPVQSLLESNAAAYFPGREQHQNNCIMNDSTAPRSSH